MFSVKGLKKKSFYVSSMKKIGLEVNHNVYVCVCERGEGEGGWGKKKGVGLETKLKPCTSTHVKFTNGPNYDSLPDHTVKLQVKCKYVMICGC